jgi:virginiamycin B lyase
MSKGDRRRLAISLGSAVAVVLLGLSASAGGQTFTEYRPDGALWFIETADKIGRITTSGAITEYPIPTSSGGGGSGMALDQTEQYGFLSPLRTKSGGSPHPERSPNFPRPT